MSTTARVSAPPAVVDTVEAEAARRCPPDEARRP
jgi:hypothetical protein